MNKKQKIVIYICLAVIAAAFILWLATGAEFYTKTKILVEKEDELFGFTYKEWKDAFIWGLDYTLAVTGASVLISAIMLFIFKNKKGKPDEASD